MTYLNRPITFPFLNRRWVLFHIPLLGGVYIFPLAIGFGQSDFSLVIVHTPQAPLPLIYSVIYTPLGRIKSLRHLSLGV